MNGTSIPGATNRDYFIQAAQPLQSGKYQVVAANMAASTASAGGAGGGRAAVYDSGDERLFSNRYSITPLRGAVGTSNRLATIEAGEPLHDGLKGGKSIWFTWRPTFTGTVSLTTQGSDFDTLLSIYTGRICGS